MPVILSMLFNSCCSSRLIEHLKHTWKCADDDLSNSYHNIAKWGHKTSKKLSNLPKVTWPVVDRTKFQTLVSLLSVCAIFITFLLCPGDAGKGILWDSKLINPSFKSQLIDPNHILAPHPCSPLVDSHLQKRWDSRKDGKLEETNKFRFSELSIALNTILENV